MLIKYSNFKWFSVKVLSLFKCCSYIKHMFSWTVYNKTTTDYTSVYKATHLEKKHFVTISKITDLTFQKFLHVEMKNWER